MRSRIIDKALASVSDQQQNLTSMTSLAAEVMFGKLQNSFP
jgi:hypothetical protein